MEVEEKERSEEVVLRRAMERLERVGFPVVLSAKRGDGTAVYSSLPVQVADGVLVTRQLLVSPDGEMTSILVLAPVSADRVDVVDALSGFAKFKLGAETVQVSGSGGDTVIALLVLPADRDHELDVVVRIAPAVVELYDRHISRMSQEELEKLYVAVSMFPAIPYVLVVQVLLGRALARAEKLVSAPVVQVVTELGKCSERVCPEPVARPAHLLALAGDVEEARRAVRRAASLVSLVAGMAGDTDTLLWLHEIAKKLEGELARASLPGRIDVEELDRIEREAEADLEEALRRVELALAGVSQEEKVELLSTALNRGLRLTSLVLLAVLLRSANIVADVDPVMRNVRANEARLIPLHAANGRIAMLAYGSTPGTPPMLLIVDAPRNLKHLKEQLDNFETKKLVTVVAPGGIVTRALAPFELDGDDDSGEIGMPRPAAA